MAAKWSGVLNWFEKALICALAPTRSLTARRSPLYAAWWRAVQPLESMIFTSAFWANIVFRVSSFYFSELSERTALWIGAWPTIELLSSMFSPQLTRYSRSFVFEVVAASFKFCKTSLLNLSFPTSRGAYALSADEVSAPFKVKSLDDLKSPKYDDIWRGEYKLTSFEFKTSCNNYLTDFLNSLIIPLKSLCESRCLNSERMSLYFLGSKQESS